MITLACIIDPNRLTIQAGRPKDRVEAFVVRVLPGAARFDVVRIDVLVLEPVLQVP